MQCPICHKPVRDAEPEYPFCSQRCRIEDLGKWASGAYRIPVHPTDEDDAPAEAQRSPEELIN
ncbi:MAG TPA: DNA gyrase inhibitor YacG [Terriglobales bacterium]|nr:DNA gyrase inhibitor YacG [Terriglobales bacterium]